MGVVQRSRYWVPSSQRWISPAPYLPATTVSSFEGTESALTAGPASTCATVCARTGAAIPSDRARMSLVGIFGYHFLRLSLRHPFVEGLGDLAFLVHGEHGQANPA